MEFLDFKLFESAEVGYESFDSYIYIKYIKESTSDDFRAIWNYTFELMDKYSDNKWFIDQTHQNVFPSDQKWHYEVWFSKVMELHPFSFENPRYIALIMPLNFYAEFTTQEFIDNNSGGGLTTNIFKTNEEAIQWLNTRN